MANMTEVDVSSQAASAWIPVNWRQDDFNLGITCTITSGATLTYDVELTSINVLNGDTVNTQDIFTHASLASETTSQSGTQTEPVTAVRINVTAYTDGTVTMRIVQGD